MNHRKPEFSAMSKSKPKIERRNGPRNAGEIKPASYNPRTISNAKLDALGKAMKEFGDLGGVVVNVRTGNCVGGHQRVKHLDPKWPITKRPAKDKTGTVALGTVWTPYGQIAYREVDWPLAKEKLANLAANQHGGEFDTDLLTDILKGLDESDRLLAGFDLPDLKELGIELNGNGAVVDAEPQIDRADALRKKWRVKSGQLWQLGEHRLLCGDSTKAEDVGRVMDGERAALCLTDPPYGIGEKYASCDDSKAALKTLIDGFFPIARERCDVILLTPGNENARLYSEPDWTLCFFSSAGVGSGPWGYCCWTPILAYGKCPYLKSGLGRRPDAIHSNEGGANELGHPCAKPLGVWKWILERGSVKSEDIIFDPFSGSGTTIMACENLHRKCRAIEIDAGYTAVALERYAVATGKTPTLLPCRAIARPGQP